MSGFGLACIGWALWLGGAAVANAPYPPSAEIAKVEFDFGTHVRRAPGSDNWPVTWAEDGEQYTAWGDGGGFGGTNSEGRVSNGFARVAGGKREYTGTNVAGGHGAQHEAPFMGKCYGVVCVQGVLYAWRTGDGSGETAYRLQELWESGDHGAQWTFTGMRFEPGDFDPPGDRGFFVPTFLQCGRDNEESHDGYVYTYAPDIKTERWEVHRPGEITLMRVPERRMREREAYEFFAGLDGEGAPHWTADVTARRPAWKDAANGVMRTSAAYVAGLGRYVLIAEHSERAKGNIGIYEAATPWGPWRTVLFESGWGSEAIESSTFFWNFCPKWFDEDGLSFVLAFTGTGSNDSWNTVEGRFVVRQAP